MSNHQYSTTTKSTNERSFYWQLVPLRLAFRLISTIAPRLTGRIALRLFRTPRKHKTPEREKSWLASSKAFQIEAGGERLIGWSWGSGPAVLLMHGWEGRGSQMGAFVEPLVEAGFRAITVDAPAHGKSTGRMSSMPQFAATVSALAERFGPIHGVIAHSLGAAATSWAAKTGTDIPRAVFIAPPGDIDDFISFFGDLLGLSHRSRREMVSQLERQFELSWEWVREVTLTPACDLSLMVIHDESDLDSPVENGRRVTAAWPEAEMMTTTGLGHRRILRNRSVVEQSVRFLSEGSTRDTNDPMPDAMIANQRLQESGGKINAAI